MALAFGGGANLAPPSVSARVLLFFPSGGLLVALAAPTHASMGRATLPDATDASDAPMRQGR